MARTTLVPLLGNRPLPAAQHRLSRVLRWLTEWADAFAEARAYAQLRKSLEDYDDHLLVDVGLRRVGRRIEALPGASCVKTARRRHGAAACRKS